MKPLLVTIPHSGEEIPPEAPWLRAIDPLTLLTDVDRFVDQLYAPAIAQHGLASVVARVHRYAADLNRYPHDVDSDAVEGETAASGTFAKGFHWVITTQGARLMPKPISPQLHQKIVALYHDSFHDEVARKIASWPKPVYHLDCHSMPSTGTGAHNDAGQARADVVISDFKGVSAGAAFKDAVIAAFEREGFKVSYNWPYYGGRITQRYGKPGAGHETIQIELNRSLYMDETTREKLPSFASTQERLTRVVGAIVGSLGA